MPDIPSKFQKDPSITFRVILLTHRQTNKQTGRQTKTGKNITSLAEVMNAYNFGVRDIAKQNFGTWRAAM